MNDQCQCSQDGFCQRYQREMTGRPREICQGINIDPAKAAKYRDNWLTMSKPPLLGDIVARTLRVLGFKTCGGCQKRKNWLNRAHEWLRGS